MSLQEVEAVSITILMDNCTDFLLTNSLHARRPPLIVNEKYNLPAPVAEHGFSALVSTLSNNNKNVNRFLFDTGVSESGVLHNADLMWIRLDQIDGIILSHGHFDHFTGLDNILKRITSLVQPIGAGKGTDIYLHPDAFLRRWEIYPDGKKGRLPFLDEKQLKKLGAIIQRNAGVKLLPANTDSSSLLITGEIPRKTSFEKGFPFQYAERVYKYDDQNHNTNDNSNENKIDLIPDPLVKDDQAIVVNVRNKGLVVITGCGHAGIINTVNYAKKVTGIDKVYVVVGGFHLPADGGLFEGAIDPTLKELQKMDPEYIIPCHCTGWKATNKIIDSMPDKFIQSAVCTTFTF
jgi:7,8-dihydropterin-6-yl-methyl-4-(beta-D-ribofuranosyl)aminobenzene 5'-phosphate synthase